MKLDFASRQPPWRRSFGLALVAACFAATSANAQLGFTGFTLTDSTLNSSPATDFWIASAAPADVDADGDLDLLIAGYYVVYPDTSGNGSVQDLLTLYRNDGAAGSAWTLTPVAVDAAGLSFTAADLAWGDYDNDGDPDVIVAAAGACKLYRNDGGTLVPTATVLPEYYEDSDFSTMDLRSVAWADYDNDGDLDLLMPSAIGEFEYLPTAILRNEGAGSGDAWVFADAGIALPASPNAVTAWADMEGDGDLDLMLGHVGVFHPNFLDTYRNDGGTFALVDSGLAHIRYGMADWGDADGDGDLDVVYAGNMDIAEGGETVVRILFREPGGSYTPVTVVESFASPQEPWLDFHAVSWADYDSDGDIDLLVGGQWLGDGEIFGRAVVYANDGGVFTLASDPLPAPIGGQAGGAFTWFDLDSDGDLDYFVAGGYYVDGGNGLIEARTQLFRNDATSPNAAPSIPTGLLGTGSAGSITFTWQAATDDDTPAAALTYDFEVVPLGPTLPAEHLLPQPGNVSRNTTWTVRDLQPGVYRWSVRAVDSAYNASGFAHGTLSITPVDVAEPNTPRRVFGISAPAPNPARGGAGFALHVDRRQAVRVEVFDVRGRRVARLHDGALAEGTYPFTFDTTRFPNGTYFVRAVGRDRTVTRRMTLLH